MISAVGHVSLGPTHCLLKSPSPGWMFSLVLLTWETFFCFTGFLRFFCGKSGTVSSPGKDNSSSASFLALSPHFFASMKTKLGSILLSFWTFCKMGCFLSWGNFDGMVSSFTRAFRFPLLVSNARIAFFFRKLPDRSTGPSLLGSCSFLF